MQGRKDTFVDGDWKVREEAVNWPDGSVSGKVHRALLCPSGRQLLLCLLSYLSLDKSNPAPTKVASTVYASEYYPVVVQVKP